MQRPDPTSQWRMQRAAAGCGGRRRIRWSEVAAGGGRSSDGLAGLFFFLIILDFLFLIILFD